MKREAIEFDVVIVGAGPAGLSAACNLMKQAKLNNQKLTVCVVEKGAEIGAHTLSGAVFETRALDELFPDWKGMNLILGEKVSGDEVYFLKDEYKAQLVPSALVPPTMRNKGNYVISLGNLNLWLAKQAELMGVDIFPNFAAAEILYNKDGSVKGIATGDMGVDRNGTPKDNYMSGMELHAKYTLFSEGCRGHLGKELIAKFELDKNVDPQHYGLGIKELWVIDPAKHKPGLVIHGTGWPLGKNALGGSFLYHAGNNQVVLGLITDLNYSNPHLNPFEEMQRMKHHPIFKQYLEGGKRISYGARAITKGGLNSLPKMTFPGGLLIGCDAGTLNFAKIKGNHTAMKSGMIAAETVISALRCETDNGHELTKFADNFKSSWLYEELHGSRNFGAALHKFGITIGSMFNYIDQNWFKGKLPITLYEREPDYAQLKFAVDCEKIIYPKPDGIISFDKLSSVFLSNTTHDEDQPCHLKLNDASIPLQHNLPLYDEPAQRYCPSGVYEIIEEMNGQQKFQINSQNCLHCKTCDIKDPMQNIIWVAPQGGGGPNYPNM